ncbi:uncharacterized protein FFFS_15900 [Fusarium fujikuroi]|nr:uncharacterized protein FFFS_15900 [Fusarium fujikuroi]
MTTNIKALLREPQARKREGKDVIRKTPSKKFKDNPDNPYITYVYSQMPTNELSQSTMPKSSTGSGSSAWATLPLPCPSSPFTGPETETEIPPISKASPNDTDFPKHPTHQEVGPQTLNSST